MTQRLARPLLAALLLASCAIAPHAAGGPYYFRAYVPNEQPFHPLDETSGAEARQLRSFCVVWYNSAGGILRAQRWTDGERVTDERYTYSDGEITAHSWIDADGVENTEAWGAHRAPLKGH